MGKRKTMRFKWQRLILPLFLAIAVGTIAYTVIDQESTLSALEQQERELTTLLEDMNTERDRLERMIDYAGTDAYVEQMARDVLGWVKDGETRYVAP